MVDARRLVLSRLVLDHRLTARDPFVADAGPLEARATELLLGDQPVSLADATAVASA